MIREPKNGWGNVVLDAQLHMPRKDVICLRFRFKLIRKWFFDELDEIKSQLRKIIFRLHIFVENFQSKLEILT